MLPVISQDKANHFAYGACIGAAVTLVAGPLIGLAAGAVFGIGKEALDAWRNRQAVKAGQQKPHGVEFADAVWTVAGAVVATAASIVPMIQRSANV